MSAIILRYIKLNLTLNHKQGDKTYNELACDLFYYTNYKSQITRINKVFIS